MRAGMTGLSQGRKLSALDTDAKSDLPCLSAVVPGMWDEGGKGQKIVAAERKPESEFQVAIRTGRSTPIL